MTRNDMRRVRGSIYSNNGYWCYEVRLPGERTRHKHALRAPGANSAMRDDRPREMAIEAAHRLWEEAARHERHTPEGAKVVDICDGYSRYVEKYYKGGSEASGVKCAIRVMRELFGDRYIGELVHTDMVRLRDALMRRNLVRNTVNRYMRIITNRMLPWACDEGLIRPAVRVELSGVQPLKRGRTDARESVPIRAVTDETIDKTIEAMMPNTADMVRVHRLTGMRPEEICCLRWSDIDTSVTPWRFTPEKNKNAWRNQPRVVCIGPRARAILEKHRSTEYPFSPVAAVFERMQALRAAAVSPSHQDRKKDAPLVKPKEYWTTCGYSRTILYACRNAGTDHWSANQIRHSLATEVRRKFGINAAAAVLGHSTGYRVTDRYSWEAAEDEMYAQAAPAIEAIG